jgi:hypothetical protein
MAKNRIRFRKDPSLTDFLAQYGTEAQCADALCGRRWPESFVALRTHDLMQCRYCRHRASLT